MDRQVLSYFHLSLPSQQMLLSRLSRNFLDYLKNIQTMQAFSRLSGNFPDHLENIQTIRKPSKLSGNFPGYLETFRTIQKISRLSRNFQDYPEISRLSGTFPDHLDNLEIFWTVWKLLSAISRVMRKNFPNEQNFSGWQCHDATMVFGPLMLLLFHRLFSSSSQMNLVLSCDKFQGISVFL